ncbi:MAG: tetratricopeptide repeat protein [Rhodospirillaceae bacterium]|nr:tetratricopeptide repeat protein [Rhodospirillaceae bacterium]
MKIGMVAVVAIALTVLAFPALADTLEELKRRAQQGDVAAQAMLGLRYKKGLGMPKNYAKAVHWYRKAAEQGHAKAQHNLGNMYYHGEGVPKDYVKAVYWYHKATEQSDARAQTKLGFMYYRGQGVLKDVVLAHMWFNIASANGRERAGKARNLLERKMSRAGIERATALARKCMASKYKTCGQ